MTGVFMRRENLDIDTHREETKWRYGRRRSETNQGEETNFVDTDLRLPDSGPMRKLILLCKSQQNFTGILLWYSWKTNIKTKPVVGKIVGKKLYPHTADESTNWHSISETCLVISTKTESISYYLFLSWSIKCSQWTCTIIFITESVLIAQRGNNPNVHHQ